MAKIGAHKHILLSKTAWLGLLVTILGVLELVEKSQLVGGNALTLIGILILLLRFFTNQPVRLKLNYRRLK